MADSLSDTDDSNSSGNRSPNWEYLAVNQLDQEAVTLITDASEVLQMDYFTTPSASTFQSSQHAEGILLTEKANDDQQEETTNSTGSTERIPVEKIDWIEPSLLYRSCTLSTDEEEDSTSRRSASPDPEIELKSEAIENGTQGHQLCTADFPSSEDPCYSDMTSLVPEESCGSKERDFTSKTWWKMQLLVLQAEGGHANTLWSIAVAAAMVGLLILGHGWHRFWVQNKKLRLEYDAKEKKISQLMYQLIQTKECICCIRQIPVIRTRHIYCEHI